MFCLTDGVSWNTNFPAERVRITRK